MNPIPAIIQRNSATLRRIEWRKRWRSVMLCAHRDGVKWRGAIAATATDAAAMKVAASSLAMEIEAAFVEFHKDCAAMWAAVIARVA